jgi:preprotein translocase subunit Sec61beta
MAGDRRKAGPLAVMKAVLWSFFGIRRRSAHEDDAVRLTPKQVVIAGLIAAAVFVTTIILVVRAVLRLAGA